MGSRARGPPAGTAVTLGEARPGEATSSRRQKLLLVVSGLLLCALLLAAIELGLGLLGLGSTDPGGEDPFVGFEAGHPLFVEQTAPGGGTVYATAEGKLRYFNRQSFPVPKPPGTFRVFALGGSTTYGRPYDHAVAFPRWLQLLLDEADPGRPHEVVNAGGVSYASYRIVVLMRELVRYEPDLFVIYTGHNEFLEERSYADATYLSPPLRWARARIDRLRSVRLLRRGLSAFAAKGKDAGHPLPAEVAARLDVLDGLAAFRRDDALKVAIVEHFRYAVGEMIHIARSHGVPIVLVAPASNLKDFSPFKSEHHPPLDAAALADFDRLQREGRALAAQGRWRDALGRFEAAAEISADHAENHFRIGRCELELGDLAAAERHLRLARQLDVCPLRAPDEISAALAQVAAGNDVPLVDLDALLRRDSLERRGHALLGDEYFLDHVHPRIEVHQLVAERILDTLADRGIVAVSRPPGPERRRALYAAALEALPPSYYALRDRNLGKVLGWAGKYEEAAAALGRAADRMPADAAIRVDLGIALLQLGRSAEAAAQLEEAAHLAPRLFPAQLNLGKALLAAGRFAPAAQAFEQAVTLDPGHASALYHLARAYHELDAPDREVAALERARAADPELPDVERLLGAAYERSGRMEESLALYRERATRQPDDPQALLDLGRAHERRQEWDAAAAAFKAALRLDPSLARAHFGLGAVQGQQGRFEEAIAAFERGLELDPDAGPAHYHLASLYAARGRSEQALPHFRRARALGVPVPDSVIAELEARPATP